MTDNIIDLKTGLPISADDAAARKYRLQDLADGLESDGFNMSSDDVWFVDSDVIDERILYDDLDTIIAQRNDFVADWIEKND